MIKKLSYTLGSKTKAQEMMYLLHDLKKVIRQGYFEEEIPRLHAFCEQHQLISVKSKFKVLLADETAYSNKGIRVPAQDQRPGMYFVYISKDEHAAWLASYYELIGNDRELGLLLGYPSCCVDFFCKRFTPDNPNLQLNPTTIFTNLTKRHQDHVIISHFPCSSECTDSIALGKKFLDVIMKIDSHRAEELLLELKPE